MCAVAETPECHDQVCITCSDHAIEARVLEMVDHDLARVGIDDEIKLVSIALVDAQPGDLILIHAGEAIAKLTV
jgi:hydrogenase expression/formation protein HypC